MDLSFATLDPDTMRHKATGCTAFAMNLSEGKFWFVENSLTHLMPDPLTGAGMISIPDTPPVKFESFIEGLRSCPSYGLHNPFRNVERYRGLGLVCSRAARALADPDIAYFFTRLIQRVMPKSLPQCMGEVEVTRDFLYNFAGDNPRFHFGRGFSTPGNHAGQESNGYRWPLGPVVIITPFNFPLEIPALQVVGALLAGNRPLLKADLKVSIVAEQFIRLLLACGLSAHDVDLIHCSGEHMAAFIDAAEQHIALCQFTGSSAVGAALMRKLRGRVKLEDSGFNPKVIGRDVSDDMLEYVAWQCDQDAYAAAGQKCSAQSLLFVHEKAYRLYDALQIRASTRTLSDLTNGPLLSVTNEYVEAHIAAILKLSGTYILWGGKRLKNHTIPNTYGAFEPTAIFVPFRRLELPKYFDLVTKELFGPLQIITTYGDQHIELLLRIIEHIKPRLAAAIVSNEHGFLNTMLGHTTNGTTYVGLRAKTTGAPQNHWFGPCGPCAAGIGTPEAIRETWTAHREIIFDTIAPIRTAAPLVQT
ncbi:MAG: aldehyde dehydrogenase family protein [bacterium]|nr:aldehyde dehydrogenase family protein [bacterium]MDZ4284407.1 aldehyde dehydrogenase family protein [Patescibacteria group bacterium]